MQSKVRYEMNTRDTLILVPFCNLYRSALSKENNNRLLWYGNCSLAFTMNL